MLKFGILYTFLIILLYAILYVNCSFFGKGVKVIVDINYFKTCEHDEDTPIIVFINFKKFNRTHSGINMNYTLLIPFDDSFTLQVEIWKWSDGGWKKNFINTKRDRACSSFYLFLGPAYDIMLEAAHAKHGCPIIPGFYYVENLNLDFSNSPLVIMPGKFFSRYRVTRNNKIAACIMAEAEITQDLTSQYYLK